MKSDVGNEKKRSKSTGQGAEEQMFRQSQQHKKIQSSKGSNSEENSYIQLKKQSVPLRWERFERMIKKKTNESQHSKENLSDMEFDVTQWDNTLWTRRDEHYRFSMCDGKEDGSRDLAVEMGSPFMKEIAGETFDEKAEKGSHLMGPPYLSVGIDSLELVLSSSLKGSKIHF
uniref:Uncharacterized protein n=1 Tax=Setaria digitata TaxID=48799 RepID=A0A915Q3Q6_9BILA